MRDGREAWHYLIALGSNVRHHRYGSPERVLAFAIARLASENNAALIRGGGSIRAPIRDETLVLIEAVAPVMRSLPLGPSLRRYANSAVLMWTCLAPDSLLDLLKRVEREFGRRGGRRWGARVLDLDIILWSGGAWRSPPFAPNNAQIRQQNRQHRGPHRGLAIPHPAYRARRFVLAPALALVPEWRDPLCGLTIRQLHARLTRPRPAPRGPLPRLAQRW